jgi:hypothetical protein
LLESLQNRLLRQATALNGDISLAEDLVSETRGRAWKHLARYNETCRLIEKLPRDIVNGAPLLYRRVEDGTFLLYSVGWNETDDGGKSVSDIGELKNVTLGDWVWKNSLKPE